ncbi:MAG: CDP-alcohol phosphatidyltransferase family protein, partial [Vampirovibrionales bacterium]|nr:CDP-alcohol phosphatidyltransferase family protein [Vampirovibrionales bacterium]
MKKSEKPFLGIGAANAVSLFRNALCFVVVGLLFSTQASDYTLAFILTVAIIWMDGLDGFLARKLGESSPVGAVIDILSDRVVEQIYWVTFAVLGWIPLWMPLLVITRGVWVDGLRSFALQKGCTAFGESSMMKSWWGVLLTSSRFSRWTYALTKAVAF